jgi:hypothetical protein
LEVERTQPEAFHLRRWHFLSAATPTALVHHVVALLNSAAALYVVPAGALLLVKFITRKAESIVAPPALRRVTGLR